MKRKAPSFKPQQPPRRSKRGRKAPTRAQPTRLGTIQRTTGTTGYTRSASASKILYSPNIGFPEKMNVRMSFCENVTLSGGSPFYQNRIYRLNSVFKPSGAAATQPQDYDLLAEVYSRFHVYRTDVRVKMYPQTASTAEDQYGALVPSNVTTLTLAYPSLVAMPRIQTCLFPHPTSDIVKQLNYFWKAKDTFSSPWDEDKGHSHVADPATLHYVIVRGGATQGSQAFSMIATVHIIYHCICSRRINSGLD